MVNNKKIEHAVSGKVFYFAPVDIYENDAFITMFVDMPGIKKDNIDIDLNKDQLIITGISEEDEKVVKDIKDGDDENRTLKKGPSFLYREFRPVSYRRDFIISDIDSEKVRANFENGVLKLELPKSEELRPRKIKVI